MNRGYFAIGIENTKNGLNMGTLWRSAYIFGAQYIFTINKRYKKQCSDTVKSWRHIPLLHYKTIDDLDIPYDCRLVGIEIIENSKKIEKYIHPERAIYLLGAEDNGLSKETIKKCHQIVQLPGEFCLNVAVAGSIVMYDRHLKAVNK